LAIRKPDPGPAGVTTRHTGAASSSPLLSHAIRSRLLSPTTFSKVSGSNASSARHSSDASRVEVRTTTLSLSARAVEAGRGVAGT